MCAYEVGQKTAVCVCMCAMYVCVCIRLERGLDVKGFTKKNFEISRIFLSRDITPVF